jgi:hypothetical protein
VLVTTNEIPEIVKDKFEKLKELFIHA